MDLNQILVFVRVVQAKSFTAAGRLLHMPKSTVSSRVSQLEERLGVRLLQRTTRSLGLTDAGAAYYDRCARIVADLEEAEQSLGEQASAPRGTLRLTAPVQFANTYLGQLIAGYRALYPEVSVDVLVTDRVVDLVEEGLDLGIRIGKLAASSLIARKLGIVENHLYAHPDYLARRGRPRSPKDLARHDCLVFSSPGHPNQWALVGPRGVAETVTVTGPLVANNLNLVRDAAAGGMGIALLPLFSCAEQVELGGLSRVLPRWTGHDGGLHAVYPTGRHLSLKVRSFLDFLVEELALAPWAHPGAPRLA
jgi:DNA-binding transcriptional LysR family regulator